MIVHTIGVPKELMIERNIWKSRVIEPKDYDPKKLQLEDLEQDGGLYVGYDRSLLSGRRVKPDGLPKKVRWSDRRPVPDFDTPHDPTMIVSQRFREVVESVEPGVHQFEPVEYVGKGGIRFADMYLFVICNRIDSINHELTTQYRFDKFWKASVQGSRTVFNAAQVGNHHLWIDKYLPDYRLVSSTFVDAVRAAGLVGVSFREMGGRVMANPPTGLGELLGTHVGRNRSGVGSGGIAVFQAELAGDPSFDKFTQFINLALKAGFGVGFAGLDPILPDLDGDGYE